ncbi:thermonuclease family protein [Coraliomargarita akajimensis]|uniref:TNase-like domain-containing protein n=1 Tax=Coraliomargarita akajimensis (strain DSM 45221 / IAM 15411 / JCM 23193 / KCTC 12865 / 04OKA010-24) TaxID=583355 RepID=D5EL37_CORAD|nr:thermonuclease family protein [Coraliomargarita akajimensis]ADE53139.1 hypothetical protein Caka_0110 [Coraliomargarita akajimensis DSM 45221]
MNEYQKLTGVSLSEHRNNDGDSFFVRHEDDQFELRLYFVDTPEKYLHHMHASQRLRVADQAEDFDITVEQAVGVGKAARSYVTRLLTAEPFTVYTNWDPVYDKDDSRYHGFVEIRDPDQPDRFVYLSELLIRRGLARIHTWGEHTPDGRSWRAYKAHLLQLARKAEKDRVGAWSL